MRSRCAFTGSWGILPPLSGDAMKPDREEPAECEGCGKPGGDDGLYWFEGWAGERWLCEDCASDAAMEE